MRESGYWSTIDDAPVAVVDLSASGVQVKGSVQVHHSQSLVFKISVPHEPLCTALGRVQWVQLEPAKGEAEASYRIGLAFEVWDVRAIKDIVERCRWASIY